MSTNTKHQISLNKVHPGENLKVNYPKSNFRQDNLSTWQPIMTPLKVVVLFLMISVTFIPIGYSLINSSANVN